MAEPGQEEATDQPSELADLSAEPEGPAVESIRIYLRSRPVQETSENIEYDQGEGQLVLRVPKEASTG